MAKLAAPRARTRGGTAIWFTRRHEDAEKNGSLIRQRKSQTRSCRTEKSSVFAFDPKRTFAQGSGSGLTGDKCLRSQLVQQGVMGRLGESAKVVHQRSVCHERGGLKQWNRDVLFAKLAAD